MSETKNTAAPLFTKENYKWMLIGAAIIALGFFLMSGGKSSDPNVFDYKEVYSTTRHYHCTHSNYSWTGGRDLCDF